MACRIALRAVFLTEPWLPFPFFNKLSTFTPIKKTSTPNLCYGCKIALNSKSYQFSSNCSNKGDSSPSSDDSEQGPPQEAVLKAISEVSRAEGRVGQTTNVVIGGTVADDSTNEWLALDQKVNSYPTVRGFTAIGTGGDDFVQAMIVAVESVLQMPIPEGQVKQKISSGGKYVSVNIGPVQVVSSEQNGVEYEEGGESPLSSTPCSPNQNSRPTSMVIKKANRVIPAHLVAEAISTLHGVDHNLRWSGPITPAEMQYVEQYVLAKYPEYCNGLVEETPDLYTLCESSSPPAKTLRESPSSPSDVSTAVQLEPSKLADTLAKKASFEGNFMSIPEIQARNRALERCGLSEEEYVVVFATSGREAMMMVGEAYPFLRGKYYMTVVGAGDEGVREAAWAKESKVVAAPETWLDLRIKGSQLSQYFRRKCKYSWKGVFAYPAVSTNGCRSSMHWISEAHRNSWHVLLDATGLGFDECLALALHRPDFVTCTVDITHAHPSTITCLLVRKKSFTVA